MLANHPDRSYVEFILNGIRDGFWVGFHHSEGGEHQLVSAKKSADEHCQVVTDYLEAEQCRGSVLGPFSREEVPGVHLSRFGVIPKSHQLGKWRLIIDLSYPEGGSVNDGIDPNLTSLHYVRVDVLIRQLVQLGPDVLMAKLDIKSAYRNVPVHPQDCPLLGMQWEGKVYVDATLLFGLRYAPKIFLCCSRCN